jgi:hypothetical protein
VPNRSCIVSFTDSEGLQHSVEVTAESLYEAAVLAIRLFREHDCEPGIASRIEVDVRTPSVKHTVTVQKVRDWVNGAAKSPKEKVMKESLKEILKGKG